MKTETKKKDFIKKYLCCSSDLTKAARLIAFFGIAVSVLLITILLNDSNVNNYHISRKTALALGLDWRHIHPYTTTSQQDDPEGRMISAIMIFYSAAFFLTNGCLLLASILHDPSFSIPWLICEMFGCVSKFAALVFHVVTEREKLSEIFVIGSIIYIIVMVWWWLVIFSAQTSWAKQDKRTIFEMSEISSSTVKESSSILMKSPASYKINHFYATI